MLPIGKKDKNMSDFQKTKKENSIETVTSGELLI